MIDEYHSFLLLLFSIFTRIVSRVLYIFPIKRNRVLFQSFRGKQYSCNPKYVSMKLKELYGDELEIGWGFHQPEKFKFLEEEGIRVLGDRTFEFLRFAITSKVVCVNTYYKPSVPRRHGQYFVRTWHGGGAYKLVGKYIKSGPFRRLSVAMQQQGAHLYLSSGEAFTRLTLRDAFGYKGEVFEYGMPRNDAFINGGCDEWTNEVKRALGIDISEKLVLYAPTFREDSIPNEHELDYKKLEAALAERFGGVWKSAYRGHYVVTYFERVKTARAIYATDYPDMQKLLYAADVLITDYSSSMWDMLLLKKPVFLYATDISQYNAERDFFYDIHTWPFPLAENNDELADNIRKFDETKYLSDIRAHYEFLGGNETGKASEMTAKRIYEVCTAKK